MWQGDETAADLREGDVSYCVEVEDRSPFLLVCMQVCSIILVLVVFHEWLKFLKVPIYDRIVNILSLFYLS